MDSDRDWVDDRYVYPLALSANGLMEEILTGNFRSSIDEDPNQKTLAKLIISKIAQINLSDGNIVLKAIP
jgi:hypothetical protein